MSSNSQVSSAKYTSKCENNIRSVFNKHIAIVTAESKGLTYEQKRAIHDEKRMNHYDRLSREMQKKRTDITTSPTIKKYDNKGSIQHEPQTSTTKKMNFHTYTLNHSVVTKNNI